MLKSVATSIIKNQGELPIVSLIPSRFHLKLNIPNFRHIPVRAMSGMSYKTLSVTQPLPFVHQVELNRPDKLNAFSHTMWL